MIATVLLRLGALFALCGMALGIAMGIRQDFTLAPAHAHINLVGFVGLFLAGLYYRLVPEAAASALAKLQAGVAVLAAVIFPVGIGGVLLSGRDAFELITVIGAVLVFVGMALFAVIVFRTSGGTRAASSARSAPASSAAMPRESR
jgi:cbb3-type cytochrome oxidase subunit 1